jgi:alcohol dehydrogenase
MLATLGARPLAVVGTDAKRRFLLEQRGLPAGNVIVRDRRRFGSQLDAALAALAANGLDCVLDAVMGPSFRPAFERMAPQGRYVVFGAADFMSPRSRPDYLRLALAYLRRSKVDPLSMIPVNRSLMAFNLIWLWDRTDRLPGACSALLRLHPDPPHVGAVLPFERAPDALRRLQSGGTIGKVVLTV